MAALVNGLQSLNRKAERAIADLGEEREALLLTKEKLKQEIAVRRDSEKALQQRERLYRTLAENIKDVIWTMDLNFRFTYVSPATQAMQGWTVEELLALRLEDILTPGSLKQDLRGIPEGDGPGGPNRLVQPVDNLGTGIIS